MQIFQDSEIIQSLSGETEILKELTKNLQFKPFDGFVCQENTDSLANKNNDIVDEMNKIVGEICDNRKKHTGSSFYSAMDEFQYKTLFDNRSKPSNAVIYEDKNGRMR